MAYERMNLNDGTTFNASHVKHLEDGIAAATQAAEAGVSEEQVKTAVNAYLQENPVESGATAEQAAQIAANTEAIEALQQSSGGSCPINYVESLDTSNLVNLRDLETGPYVLYGYFSPYANSDMSMTFDNTVVIVARKSAGSHLFVLTGLNSKINFLEILVDETAEKGFTYSRTDFNLLEMNEIIAKVGILDDLTTDEKTSIVAAINELAATVKAHNESETAHEDIRQELSQLSAKIADIGTQDEIVQKVIDALGGTPVFGTVDANNNIVLTGNLANGTYTLKYEDADGNVTVIGTLNHTYVPEPTYTNVLTQAIDSNKTPYNGGQGWKTGYRLNSSSVESANEGMEVTGFIPVKQGDVVRFANIQWPVNSGVAANKCYVSLFKSDFSPATSTNSDQCFIREIDSRLDGVVGTDSEGNLNEFAINPEIFVNVANWSEVAYMRVSAYEITADSIITKNESIN